MARVITFSRVFPAYHPKRGLPTHFVEKLLLSFMELEYISKGKAAEVCRELGLSHEMQREGTLKSTGHKPKNHTIRAGNRWKVGDKFSPRVWTAKPYKSPMITIGPDIEIKKLWEFEIRGGAFFINGRQYDGEIESHHELLELIAQNDGLEKHELVDWFDFSKSFKGQIICWNEKTNY